MAFKDTYRLEKVYYENIWTLLKLLKNVDKNNVDMGTVKELLDNAIADNESIIIIYKNLGELYAELQNQHMELGKELEKLKDSLEEFKDEINDKIDENHNYIMSLIRDLEQRVDAIEADLSTMSRNKILDLVNENGVYHLELNGDTISYSDITDMIEFPHDICVRGNVNGESTEFRLREFDTDPNSGMIEFYAEGLIDNVIHEITVTVLPDDSVNVATDIQVIVPGVDLWGGKASGDHSNIFNNVDGNRPNTAIGNYATAEGNNTQAGGYASHAEGMYAYATGDYSHAEGSGSRATGSASHAEANGKSYGNSSHAEGSSTTGDENSYGQGNYAHAEGNNCVAYGENSHSEGESTSAKGRNAHSEGQSTVANGTNSHAEGNGTIANGPAQHVEGQFNIPDNTHIEIVGIGQNTNSRKNGRTLDLSGNEWISGQIQPENGVRLKDANGVYYNLTVDTTGNLVVTPV